MLLIALLVTVNFAAAFGAKVCTPDNKHCAEINKWSLNYTNIAKDHVTDKYESSARRLTVRRGREFNVTVSHVGFDGENFQLRAVVKHIGKLHCRCAITLRLLTAGSARVVPLKDEYGSLKDWAGRIDAITPSELKLQLRAPARAAVGRWSLKFELYARGGRQARHERNEDVIVLFNPWNEG